MTQKYSSYQLTYSEFITAIYYLIQEFRIAEMPLQCASSLAWLFVMAAVFTS
uniref:Uncharacterized protein n=1 Tax=Arundo donax TaxID=35708 RepID=A0A0A9BLI0_ARUDO